jgi:outer membrane protein assembly factor BamB
MVMKIYYITGIFFILSVTTAAQNKTAVLYTETVIGKNNTLNRDIYAREFIFDGNILQSYVDSLSQLLTMVLADNNNFYTGDVVVYDMQKRELAWTKPVNYSLGNVEWFSNFLLYRQLNWNYALDGKTGNELWRLKNDIYLYDRLNMVAIGYKSGVAANRLQGIDLEDGGIIWERKLYRAHGWNSMHRLNDTVLLIAASGLHAVNVRTGEGWDYDAVTWKQHYDHFNRGSYITLNDVVSNVLIDSTGIFFAGKDKLVMLDYDGNVLWSIRCLRKTNQQVHIDKKVGIPLFN